MSYAYEYSHRRVAAEAAADARAAFIRRTYGHLAVAILAFAALEAVLVRVVPAELIGSLFAGRFSWLLCLLAFMGVAWLADTWARSNASPTLQYLGLGLYVAAEAVIFLPLLYVAANLAAPDVIPKAGILTLTLFGGLTVAVFITRHDFSYLRTILCIGSCVALGLIVVGLFLGGGLGLWFSFAMVALASGFILYDRSNVLHHYRTDQHVAAALALFAAVALLFWYVLRILLATSSRD
jgi:FtsH-binding integral membrane protein